MSGSAFFDTNVLLYLLSADLAKAERAETLLAQGGSVSVQVLNEFASVALRKLRMTWAEIGDVLDTVTRICIVVPLTLETHHAGRDVAVRYGYHVYDAMIIAAAIDAGADVLYSEDMQDGQRIDNVLAIRNPFVK